jgi:hypothetical protein
MPNKNITWKLGAFLSHDTVHKLVLSLEQIDIIHDVVDWDIVSSYNLPTFFILKHKKLINWPIYLQNEYPKDIKTLIQVKDKITENQHLFYDMYMKRKYYTPEFINNFAYMIDWNWVCKNIKLDENMLLTYWDKFRNSSVAKYQNITDRVAKIKLHSINWIIASKKKLSEYTISLARNYVNWELICKYQKKLSISFLHHFNAYLHWPNTSKYQELTDSFIIKYHTRLNMTLVCTYQNMSLATIRELENIIKFDVLIKNNNYNKPNTIQITTNGKLYFVIEPPPIGNISRISYYSAEGALF